MDVLSKGFLNSLNRKLLEHPTSLPIILGFSPELVEYCKNIKRPFAFILPPDWPDDDLPFEKKLFLVKAKEPKEALKKLTKWQIKEQGKPFLPISIPYFWKKYSQFYPQIYHYLQASKKFNFWDKAKYKKFSDEPKLLLITSQYFLMGEVITACKRLGYKYHLLALPDKEVGTEWFIQTLLKAVVEFKPDFILTLNHLGVDREGVLVDLLEKIELPLASWFVDNPHLILYLYHKVKSEISIIFTWDEDNIEFLKQKGFKNVYYLPLATDVKRFCPRRQTKERVVSFVGNSMVTKVDKRIQKLSAYPELLKWYPQIASAFKNSNYLLVTDFIRDKFKHVYTLWENLPTIEAKLDYEVLITWQATLEYRKECVEKILDFEPLIAGDQGWFQLLPPKRWQYHPELNYYTELPFFYGQNKINFNATSAQMKGAVNQRIFDVPASGNFLLTDYRKQMENLFDLNKEIVFYQEKEQIPELVKFYLKRPSLRHKIIERARQKILANHTYERRLAYLYQVMTQFA